MEIMIGDFDAEFHCSWRGAVQFYIRVPKLFEVFYSNTMKQFNFDRL